MIQEELTKLADEADDEDEEGDAEKDETQSAGQEVQAWPNKMDNNYMQKGQKGNVGINVLCQYVLFSCYLEGFGCKLLLLFSMSKLAFMKNTRGGNCSCTHLCCRICTNH